MISLKFFTYKQNIVGNRKPVDFYSAKIICEMIDRKLVSKFTLKVGKNHQLSQNRLIKITKKGAIKQVEKDI